jgi:hypothetical protein
VENIITRHLLDNFLPQGFNIKEGGELDAYFDAAAEIYAADYEKTKSLGHNENPYFCDEKFLPDLEREYGLNPGDFLPNKLRRNKLAGVVYKKEDYAVYSKLQEALDGSGFGKGGYGLRVYPNESPACNPQDIITGWSGSYYLVNGIQFSSNIKYWGCEDMIVGNSTACCGYYAGFEGFLREYFTPPAKYWGMVFFVGGEAERNPDGSIKSIAPVGIPQWRQQELHQIILRIKPLWAWALLVVNITTFG